MYLIFFLLLLSIFVFCVLFQPVHEGYRDILPIPIIDNISKCYDKSCVLSKGYDCYKYCATINNIGSRENCRMSCEDYSDIMFHHVKYNNNIFGSSLKDLNKYSLLYN